MRATSIEEIMNKAREFNAHGKKWHFHMLTPDCMFNERKDKHAFVLENETDDEVFVTYSDERYMEQGKELVEMLHGTSITKGKCASEDENMELMLRKAKELNEGGISWHHHMLFPNCIYNKHKGKWCIVFEDKEQNRVIESVSDKEPTADLSKIEKLYYEQKR
jgi:hypothetical protein